MHVWIVQTGEPMFTDGPNVRPMRAMNLASRLLELDHKVTLITANFDHFTKQKRFDSDKKLNLSQRLTIQFIDSPGYKKNISMMRFIDHFILGYRMRKIMREYELPDIAFIGYPPIETSWFMSGFFKSKNVPFVLDVKDAWPTNIVDAVPRKFRFIAKLILFPYFRMYSASATSATALCSITNTFLEWAQSIGKRNQTKNDFVAFLTSKQQAIDPIDVERAHSWFKENVRIDTDQLTIYFIGSLSRSFDFNPILEAAKALEINLVIGGLGEQYQELINLSQGMANVHLLGWVDLAQAQVIAEHSDLALAPMKPMSDFEMSIPNKFFDYMSRGKPILTSLKGDSLELVKSYNVGIYYSDASDLILKLQQIYQGAVDLKKMSANCLNIFAERFDYEKVYGDVVSRLIQLSEK